MATHCRQFGCSPERSRSRHPLRWDSEKTLGCQLRVYGILRLRDGPHLLGSLGV